MAEPNFFVIGAQKCGTTAMYDALNKHPDIFMSRQKEPFYFATNGALPHFWAPSKQNENNFIYKWDDYVALFDGRTTEKAIGEASAIYLSSYYPEQTAQRIHDKFPNARIIAMIRQPADRAYSAFHFYRGRDIEKINDFEKALNCEEERIHNNEIPDLRHFSNGLYYKNLKPYFDFFPRDQIRVYLFEDWVNNNSAVLEDVFKFLEVDDSFKVESKKVNAGYSFKFNWLRRLLLQSNLFPTRLGRFLQKYIHWKLYDLLLKWNRRKIPRMSPTIRTALTNSYKDDIIKLQKLIARDLASWLPY